MFGYNPDDTAKGGEHQDEQVELEVDVDSVNEHYQEPSGELGLSNSVKASQIRSSTLGSGEFSTASDGQEVALTNDSQEQQGFEAAIQEDDNKEAVAAAAAVGTAAAVGMGVAIAANQQPEEVEAPAPPVQKVQPQAIEIDEGLPSSGVNVTAGDTTNQPDVKPKSEDFCCVCRCCGCPNGATFIIMAQFFLFGGVILGSWSLTDCKFMEATAGWPERYYPSISTIVGAPDPNTTAPTPMPTMAPPPDMRRGFGFIFNETEEGNCGWTDEGRYWHEEEFENYQDFVDWRLPLFLASGANSLAWLIWLWTFTFWCCSYIRAVRMLTAAIIALVITGCHCSIFSVVASDFCEEPGADCEPARGFWIGIAAAAAYFISGILFAFMKDYPGAIA